MTSVISAHLTDKDIQSITTLSARTDLFAATDVSSTVKDFTVQGNIALSVGNTDNGKNAGVGGTSTGGVDITRCVYETDSSVSITNSTDCIGGVVGYAARNTKISYCANRSTVTTEKMMPTPVVCLAT